MGLQTRRSYGRLCAGRRISVSPLPDFLGMLKRMPTVEAVANDAIIGSEPSASSPEDSVRAMANSRVNSFRGTGEPETLDTRYRYVGQDDRRQVPSHADAALQKRRALKVG